MDTSAVRAAPPLYPQARFVSVEVSQGETVAPDTPTPAAGATFWSFPPKSLSQELNFFQIHPNNK